MQEEQTRRKSPRASISFIAYCSQENLNEVGIKVCNLSTGGMGIKTNYPLNLKERLAVAFQLPRSFNTVLCVSAEVIWLQPNGGAPGHDETFLTGGIRFRYLQESTQALLNEYTQNLSD